MKHKPTVWTFVFAAVALLVALAISGIKIWWWPS